MLTHIHLLAYSTKAITNIFVNVLTHAFTQVIATYVIATYSPA